MAKMKEVTVPVRVDFTSNVLSGEQVARVAALKAARVSLVSSGPLTQGAADPIDLVNVARYIETGVDPYQSLPIAQTSYPYQDGDVTVLGPEVFVGRSGDVISWRGQNYYAKGGN